MDEQDQIETVKLTYSILEVVELTGLSATKIRHHIKADRLHAHHNSDGSLTISRRDLARWWRFELNRGELFERNAHLDH